MSEIYTADRWINETLRADAPLMGYANNNVWADVIPQTDPPKQPPYVLFQLQAATDLGVVGGIRVWSNMLYLVRGITETGGLTGTPLALANRIDALLHNAAGSNVNGVIFSSVREQPFKLAEIVDGRTFRHLGGMYRIFARGA